MNAEDLRSIQAPLKERYREAPEAALITLRAKETSAKGQVQDRNGRDW